MADEHGSDHVTVKVASTLADQAAFLRYVSRRPSRLALQASIFVVLGLAFIVLQVAIDLVGALFVAKHGMLAAAKGYFTTHFHRNLRGTLPWIGLVVTVLFLLNLLVLVPRQCRSIAARIVNGYPELAGAGPAARLVGSLRLDARGAESATPNERLFVAWPLFDRLVETRRHLFLMTGGSSAMVLPKDGIDAADLAQVHKYCRRFLGATEART